MSPLFLFIVNRKQNPEVKTAISVHLPDNLRGKETRHQVSEAPEKITVSHREGGRGSELED